MSRGPENPSYEREQREAARRVENTTNAPQRLQRDYISWIRGGMSGREAERVFGADSPGEFQGMDRRVTVPVDLRESFYDDLLTQAFLSVYTSLTSSPETSNGNKLREQLALSAMSMVELIVSIAGSHAREQSQYGFELQATDRGRNVMSYQDMVKVQIAIDQFGVLAAFPQENKILDMAIEIAQGGELSQRTMEEISAFRLSARSRLDAYNASLGVMENETIGVPIDVREDARAYAGLLILMNRNQMEQIIQFEISRAYEGASIDDVLDQVYLLTMNTDIAPGVVYRHLQELGDNLNDDYSRQQIIETIEKINVDRAKMASELERVHSDMLNNLQVGDVQTFGKRGTFLNLLAMIWGMTTASLSVIKSITRPKTLANNSFFIATGLGVANFAYNRMRGGRGTEGFSRLAQRFNMSPEARHEYGKEVVTAEVAALTAQEVGFEITRDFYANEKVIQLLRGLTLRGTNEFTIEAFERQFEIIDLPQSTRDAYTQYRTSTSDEYLAMALNFVAHGYQMLEIENTSTFVQHVGSRVGLLQSDFETN